MGGLRGVTWTLSLERAKPGGHRGRDHGKSRDLQTERDQRDPRRMYSCEDRVESEGRNR